MKISSIILTLAALTSHKTGVAAFPQFEVETKGSKAAPTDSTADTRAATSSDSKSAKGESTTRAADDESKSSKVAAPTTANFYEQLLDVASSKSSKGRSSSSPRSSKSSKSRSSRSSSKSTKSSLDYFREEEVMDEFVRIGKSSGGSSRSSKSSGGSSRSSKSSSGSNRSSKSSSGSSRSSKSSSSSRSFRQSRSVEDMCDPEVRQTRKEEKECDKLWRDYCKPSKRKKQRHRVRSYCRWVGFDIDEEDENVAAIA